MAWAARRSRRGRRFPGKQGVRARADDSGGNADCDGTGVCRRPLTAVQILALWNAHEKAAKHALGSIPPAGIDFSCGTIQRDLGLMYFGILMAYRVDIADAVVLSNDMAKYMVEHYGQHAEGHC